MRLVRRVCASGSRGGGVEGDEADGGGGDERRVRVSRVVCFGGVSTPVEIRCVYMACKTVLLV